MTKKKEKKTDFEKDFGWKTFDELTPEQKDQFKKQKFQCLICGQETTGFCDHKVRDSD